MQSLARPIMPTPADVMRGMTERMFDISYGFSMKHSPSEWLYECLMNVLSAARGMRLDLHRVLTSNLDPSLSHQCIQASHNISGDHRLFDSDKRLQLFRGLAAEIYTGFLCDIVAARINAVVTQESERLHIIRSQRPLDDYATVKSRRDGLPGMIITSNFQACRESLSSEFDLVAMRGRQLFLIDVTNDNAFAQKKLDEPSEKVKKIFEILDQTAFQAHYLVVLCSSRRKGAKGDLVIIPASGAVIDIAHALSQNYTYMQRITYN